MGAWSNATDEEKEFVDAFSKLAASVRFEAKEVNPNMVIWDGSKYVTVREFMKQEQGNE